MRDAAITPVGGVQSAEARSPDSALPLLLLLVIPFFFKLTPHGITLGDPLVPLGGGQTVPISVIICPALAAYALLKEPTILRGSLPVAVFAGCNLLAMLVGLLSTPRVENVLFCLQTLLPLSAFIVALFFMKTERQICRLFVAWTLSLGLFMWVLVIHSFWKQGTEFTLRAGLSWFLGFLPLYTLFDYAPTVISVVYGLGLGLLTSELRTRTLMIVYTMLTGLFGAVFLLHSKGGILTVLSTMFIWFAVSVALRRRVLRWMVFATPHAALAIWMLFAIESQTAVNMRALALSAFAETSRGRDNFMTPRAGTPAATAHPRVPSGSLPAAGPRAGTPAATAHPRVPSGSLPAAATERDRSVVSRLENLRHAASVIRERPLLGARYQAFSKDRHGVYRIANPHNQYLTYAVRGGLLSLLAFVGILVGLGVQLAGMFRRTANAEIRALWIGVVSGLGGAVFVSTFLQDNFTQPYPAMVLWFLLGVAHNIVMRNKCLLKPSLCATSN